VHDVVGGRRVGIAHTERDDVLSRRPPLRDPAVELGEQVRGKGGDPLGEPHEMETPRAASHRPSRTPSKLRSTPPVMNTLPPSSRRQSMSRTPPGNRTSHRAGARPARWAATSDAQAPVPHAIVSPTPRSQTRTDSPDPVADT